MHKKLLLLVLLTASVFPSRAEITNDSLITDSVTHPFAEDGLMHSLGIGLGMDYGGLGLRFTSTLFTPYVAVILAGGYNFYEPVYCLGVEARLSPKTRVCPYLAFLYGYNTVFLIRNGEKFNRTFYGNLASLGLEIHSKRRSNYFNVEFLLPIRGADVDTYFNKLQRNTAITGLTRPPDFGISFGVHWGL